MRFSNRQAASAPTLQSENEGSHQRRAEVACRLHRQSQPEASRPYSQIWGGVQNCSGDGLSGALQDKSHSLQCDVVRMVNQQPKPWRANSQFQEFLGSAAGEML